MSAPSTRRRVATGATAGLVARLGVPRWKPSLGEQAFGWRRI